MYGQLGTGPEDPTHHSHVLIDREDPPIHLLYLRFTFGNGVPKAE